jgi:hypothetical protein
MGQAATLYRIDRNEFSKIGDNPDGFNPLSKNKGYEVFDKSFDGLQFVLSKGVDQAGKELVEQIFYPNTFIEVEVDFSKLDFDDLPDDFDVEQQPVYYNDPDTVSKIASLLDTISSEQFAKDFDHHELNRENVYPGDIWNEETQENISFNLRHMLTQFENLKSIFSAAKKNEEYLLSYVG